MSAWRTEEFIARARALVEASRLERLETDLVLAETEALSEGVRRALERSHEVNRVVLPRLRRVGLIR